MKAISEYKVGDDIAYNTSRRYWSAWAIRFDKVVKINGHGHIFTENGRKFNKYGEEMITPTCSYPSACIVDINRAKELIIQDNKTKDINNAVNGLLTALSTKKTGHGDYHLEDDIVQSIKALTEKITTKK